MKKFFVLLLACVLALSLSCCKRMPDDGNVPSDGVASDGVASDGAAAAEIEYALLTATDSFMRNGEVYGEVTVSYPELTAGAPEESLNVLNRALADIAYGIVANWQDEEEALFAEDFGFYAVHDVDMWLQYGDGEILSVIADTYRNVEGAAHPEVRRFAYTFRIMDGSRVQIEDLLGEDWEDVMVEAVLAAIGEDTTGYYDDLDFLLRDCFHADQWYADREGVHVIFQPYDIGPYALGIQEFVIPY